MTSMPSDDFARVYFSRFWAGIRTHARTHIQTDRHTHTHTKKKTSMRYPHLWKQGWLVTSRKHVDSYETYIAGSVKKKRTTSGGVEVRAAGT